MRWNQLAFVMALCFVAGMGMTSCSSDTVPSGQLSLATQMCVPGTMQACPCPQGQSAMQVCGAEGSYPACPVCQATASGGLAMSTTGGLLAGTGGSLAGTGGVVPLTGGSIATTGGMSTTTGGAMVTTGGMMDATGGAATTGGSGTASGSVSGIADAELETLRQVCIDEINMYRSMKSLAPLPRGTPEQELCSDQGAKKDGDSGNAHSSAGTGNPCNTTGMFNAFPNFTSQNTCPGYMVGGFGSATIADALKQCLAQMWAEGEPPEGRAKCESDYFAGDTACFLAYGHYLNMTSDAAGVSCGFYDMGSSTYWMNQDFF